MVRLKHFYIQAWEQDKKIYIKASVLGGAVTVLMCYAKKKPLMSCLDVQEHSLTPILQKYLLKRFWVKSGSSNVVILTNLQTDI